MILTGSQHVRQSSVTAEREREREREEGEQVRVREGDLSSQFMLFFHIFSSFVKSTLN